MVKSFESNLHKKRVGPGIFDSGGEIESVLVNYTYIALSEFPYLSSVLFISEKRGCDLSVILSTQTFFYDATSAV